MFDLCCGEETFVDTIPFVMQSRPETAWHDSDNPLAGLKGKVQEMEEDGEAETPNDDEHEDAAGQGEGRDSKKANLMGVPRIENQMSR